MVHSPRVVFPAEAQVYDEEERRGVYGHVTEEKRGLFGVDVCACCANHQLNFCCSGCLRKSRGVDMLDSMMRFGDEKAVIRYKCKMNVMT